MYVWKGTIFAIQKQQNKIGQILDMLTCIMWFKNCFAPHSHHVYDDNILVPFQECKKTFEGSEQFYCVEGQSICGPCAGEEDQWSWKLITDSK